jgi:hypothetical protein
MNKKIIHFIFNLGRGGAETMLVRVIKELPEYQHVVVTLFPMNHFGDELKCDRLICLNLGSLFSLPFAVFKFRRLVKKENLHWYIPICSGQQLLLVFLYPEKYP